ncbi:HAMP domain-containing protein [Candidatus Micrarchaeota archaeon]|nr:HAMP domain-containing protein [Candidatus Micrarchaeota archaeon]
MKILHEIILITVAVAIAIAVASGTLLLEEEKKIISSSTRGQVRQMAGYAYEAVDVYFSSAKDSVEVLAQDHEILDALRDETVEALEKASVEMTGVELNSAVIENVGLHNDKGVVLAASEGAKAIVGRDLSDRNYYKQIISTKKTVVSEAIASSLSNKSVLVAAAPAFYEGKIIGYAVGAIDLSDLKKRLSALEDDEADVILLDSLGNNFLDTRKAGISITTPTIEGDRIGFQVLRELEKNSSGFLELSDESGKKFQVSFRKLDYATVVIIHSQAQLDKLIAELFSLILVGAVTSALLAVLLIVVTVRRLTGHIESITQTIEDISKGKLDTRIDPKLLKRDDELGELARAFDRTIVSLKLSMKDKPKD